MARRLKHSLRSAVRIFWGTLLFLVISLAVVVQLGRALFPVLDDYRSVVEQQLSRQLRVDVAIGAIEAEWDGLRPQLHLLNVAVDSFDGESIFKVQRVDLEISLLSTLRDWRLALRTLTFSGLSAVVLQDETGRWQVQGLGQLSPDDLERDRFSINDPLDIFLFGRRVEMLDTALNFHFRNGLVTDIAIPTIRLDNDTHFHRLAAEFSIDKGEQALSLIVEGHGDPRESASFDAQGYLTLSAFPSEKVLAALGIANDILLGGEDYGPPANWRDTGQVDLRLWFEGTGTKGLQWWGDMAVRGVPVIPPPGMRWPRSLDTDFSGKWHPEAGWSVDLANAHLRWAQFAAPLLNARVGGKLGEPTQLQIAQVDVGAWHQVAQRAQLLPKSLQPILEGLAPAGHLRNLVLTHTSPEEGHFRLQAEVDQARVSSWRDVPAIAGVDGYLETDALGGHFVIASEHGFSLDFPKLYSRPLQMRLASGDLAWQVDTQQRLVAISSGLLRVSNDDIAAAGHLNLRLPYSAESTAEPELTLAIGVRKGAATLHRLLVPYTIPEALYQWLDDGVQKGVVTNGGFIYHGPLKKDSPSARVIQLSASVAEGELVFDPAWPPLTDASAVIVLDDDDFYVANLQGQMMGVAIDNGQVTLEPLPQGQGRAIRLRGDVAADSSNARDLLRASPLKEILGEQLTSWALSGPVTGELDIQVPLQRDADGARQSVSLDFVDNRLYVPHLDIGFEKLNGRLSYSDDKGVEAHDLSAKLWGHSVQAQLTSQWQGAQKQVRLDFAGQMDVAHLQDWARRPELSFASGATAFNGHVVVPLESDSPLQLHVASMLQGVKINLPEPFYKAAEDTRRLLMDIDVRSESETRPASLDYDLRLQDQVQVRVRTHPGGMGGISLGLGVAAAEVNPGSIEVSGALARVDLPVWGEVLDAYLLQSARQEAERDLTDLNEALPVNIALDIEQLQLGSLHFSELQVSGGRQRDVWTLAVQSPAMSGRYRISPGQPMDVNLTHLRLPKLSGPSTEQVADYDSTIEALEPGGMAQVDILSLDAVDFSVERLFLGDLLLGKWQFNLRPVSGGIIAYDLNADLKQGTRIGALEEQDKGASLIWLRSDLGDVSYFSGGIDTGDVGDLLTHFGQERILSSEEAGFDVTLQWPGAPDTIGLNKLLGVIDLKLQRGRFIRGAEVGENPVVKLLGLLNFDTLARRLRLDFSDLNPEGLGYEKVQGSLTFKEGVIEVNEPLQVDSPASHIQFVGDIDLLQQTVDAQLITTFPLTGNLTMAAALTGVLPAAVGVFVVGKLFKEQLDRVSSIRYSIDGSWSEPKVNVERVFENQTNHQRAQTRPE